MWSRRGPQLKPNDIFQGIRFHNQYEPRQGYNLSYGWNQWQTQPRIQPPVWHNEHGGQSYNYNNSFQSHSFYNTNFYRANYINYGDQFRADQIFNRCQGNPNLNFSREQVALPQKGARNVSVSRPPKKRRWDMVDSRPQNEVPHASPSQSTDPVSIRPPKKRRWDMVDWPPQNEVPHASLSQSTDPVSANSQNAGPVSSDTEQVDAVSRVVLSRDIATTLPNNNSIASESQKNLSISCSPKKTLETVTSENFHVYSNSQIVDNENSTSQNTSHTATLSQNKCPQDSTSLNNDSVSLTQNKSITLSASHDNDTTSAHSQSKSHDTSKSQNQRSRRRPRNKNPATAASNNINRNVISITQNRRSLRLSIYMKSPAVAARNKRPVAATASKKRPVSATARNKTPAAVTARNNGPAAATARNKGPATATARNKSPVASTVCNKSPVAATRNKGPAAATARNRSTVRNKSPVAATARNKSRAATTAQNKNLACVAARNRNLVACISRKESRVQNKSPAAALSQNKSLVAAASHGPLNSASRNKDPVTVISQNENIVPSTSQNVDPVAVTSQNEDVVTVTSQNTDPVAVTSQSNDILANPNNNHVASHPQNSTTQNNDEIVLIDLDSTVPSSYDATSTLGYASTTMAMKESVQSLLNEQEKNKNDNSLSQIENKDATEDDIVYLFSVDPIGGKLVELVDLSEESQVDSISTSSYISVKPYSGALDNTINNDENEKSYENSKHEEPVECGEACCYMCNKRLKELSNNNCELYVAKCGHLFCMLCIKKENKCIKCKVAITNLRKVL